MSAVEILPAGAKATSGAGDAVDVSAHSTLRLVGTFAPGTCHDMHFVIEHGPTASGPWAPLTEWRRRDGNPDWIREERYNLSGFDKFVRARWDSQIPGQKVNPTAQELREKKFVTWQPTFGLAGEGIPDAA